MAFFRCIGERPELLEIRSCVTLSPARKKQIVLRRGNVLHDVDLIAWSPGAAVSWVMSPEYFAEYYRRED